MVPNARNTHTSARSIIWNKPLCLFGYGYDCWLRVVLRCRFYDRLHEWNFVNTFFLKFQDQIAHILTVFDLGLSRRRRRPNPFGLFMIRDFMTVFECLCSSRSHFFVCAFHFEYLTCVCALRFRSWNKKTREKWIEIEFALFPLFRFMRHVNRMVWKSLETVWNDRFFFATDSVSPRKQLKCDHLLNSQSLFRFENNDFHRGICCQMNFAFEAI